MIQNRIFLRRLSVWDRSDEEVGFATQCFVVKNLYIQSCVWEGTLSWGKVHLFGQIFGLLWWMNCHKHSKIWQPSLQLWRNVLVIITYCKSYNQISNLLMFAFDIHGLSVSTTSNGEVHWRILWFVSMPYRNIHNLITKCYF